ncbi:hypothetical protein L1987_58756 [Smallanthus sonchifolius]|uniref:Uncharacterized protein n=1 Tax=Smallanthus sonchifolius TaxID=185202 RepID=A0ACB9D3F5_9ASTR|nr:hypothetical protein L1987_58756 [Smallanthus sonchifolius]
MFLTNTNATSRLEIGFISPVGGPSQPPDSSLSGAHSSPAIEGMPWRHKSDKSKAGADVIIGGYVMACVVVVLLYIRVTRRTSDKKEVEVVWNKYGKPWICSENFEMSLLLSLPKEESAKAAKLDGQMRLSEAAWVRVRGQLGIELESDEIRVLGGIVEGPGCDGGSEVLFGCWTGPGPPIVT